jgi:hypothetical protein
VTFVGTDVVDLEEPRTRGKAGDKRFCARVLDDVEAAAVRAALHPDEELWSHWACKEAAFKTASKVLGEPLVFAHARFGVRWDGPVPAGEPRTGRVLYQELVFPVMVFARAALVQAVAYAHPDGLSLREEVVVGLEDIGAPGAPWSLPLETLLVRFTPREAGAIHSHESAAVRLGARAALADLLRVEEARVEIVCPPGAPGRRPPIVLLDGAPARADVSLSHHGRWIAWAIHVEREERGG